jgi:glycerol-1-phosphate dehydrogenase [NAD(P)+]
VIAHFGADLARSVWPELAAKLLDKSKADALSQRIASQWNSISARLAHTFLSPARIEAVLLAAGAPTTPREIHLDRSFYEAALMHGREIRNRYTVLDVMAASGRLAKQLPTL